MKRTILILGAAAFMMTACKNEKKGDESKKETTETKSTKEEVAKSEPMTMPDSATMMKNWQEYMTPGDMHKMMASWDGTWEGDVTMTMMPGAPEEKSKSTAVNKMIMNGLYQQSEHSGNMMGMPFSGQGLTGFDIHKKEFFSTWVDNMGSGIMVMKGPWDPATKTMTLTGKVVDPGTKQESEVKETFTIIDDNTQEMKMFSTGPDGKEFQSLNIRYTRKK